MYNIIKHVPARDGKTLMALTGQNITGNASAPGTYEDLRVVRVDSLGHEPDFIWDINGFHHKPHPGDFILLSGIDMRMPILSHKNSDVMITVLLLSPRVFVGDSGFVGLFYTRDPSHRHIRAGTIPEAEREFSLLEKELTRPDFIESAATCRARLLLVELCRGLGFTPGQSVVGSHIDEITAYIGRHFTEKITLDSTAKAIGISQSLLSKEMNVRLNISFPEYVRRLRINNVLDLISSRGMSVTNAAFESGFTSMQGFYKTFREITGTSPLEMLKSRENTAKR